MTEIDKESEAAHHVAMLAYPNAQILDISGPLEVFARASRWIEDHVEPGRTAYRVEIVAEKTNQALATAAGSVPGGAAVLGTIMGVIQQAQDAAENRQVAKDEQAFAALGGADQQESLDRLLTLHEQYAAKCEGSEG